MKEPDEPTNDASDCLKINDTKAFQHPEKALSSCEETVKEIPGMVEAEPVQPFVQKQAGPFPALEGYQRRKRRPESELRSAAEMVARGALFQTASERYDIPISTIRFYMASKGLLNRRTRGRGSTNIRASINYLSSSIPPHCA